VQLTTINDTGGGRVAGKTTPPVRQTPLNLPVVAR
jgi:hypothetical protein